jgi:hypothetical protein
LKYVLDPKSCHYKPTKQLRKATTKMDDEYHKAEHVLDVIVLRKELEIVRMENKMLKEALHDNLCHTKTRHGSRSRESRERWMHYHNHKKKALDDLVIHLNVPASSISWQAVKAETDKSFVSS